MRESFIMHLQTPIRSFSGCPLSLVDSPVVLHELSTSNEPANQSQTIFLPSLWTKRVITTQSMAGYNLMRWVHLSLSLIVETKKKRGQGSTKRRLVAIHFLIQTAGCIYLIPPRQKWFAWTWLQSGTVEKEGQQYKIIATNCCNPVVSESRHQ